MISASPAKLGAHVMSRRLCAGVSILAATVFVTVGMSGPTDTVALKVDHPKGYVCYRAKAPVKIDGKLDDAVWQMAPWTDEFVDIEGDKKPKPRLRTRVKMLWDEHALYIAAEMEEPHLWGTLTKHDAIIFHDNDFEVFLDPDGDNHVYGELEINVLNTTWDLLLPIPYKDGGRAVSAWEVAGLKTAVQIDGTVNNPEDTDRGWTVEIAWPWSGLAELTRQSVPPRDGDQWRINFSRVEWKHEVHDGKYRKLPKTKEDNWVWSPQSAIDMHRPERWGYLQFSTASGDAKFQPDPAAPARELLHRAYWAQKEYYRKHGKYAASLADLGLPRFTHPSLGEMEMQATPEWFDAFVALKSRRGSERWRIRADSKIVREAK